MLPMDTPCLNCVTVKADLVTEVTIARRTVCVSINECVCVCVGWVGAVRATERATPQQREGSFPR